MSSRTLIPDDDHESAPAEGLERDADSIATQIEAEVAAGRMTLEEGHDRLLHYMMQ